MSPKKQKKKQRQNSIAFMYPASMAECKCQISFDKRFFFVTLLHVIRTLSKNPEKKLIGQDPWRSLRVIEENSLFVWESFCGC